MSELTFPSNSTHFFELAEAGYDIDQISKAVDGAIKQKGINDEEQVTPPSPSHLHLHTCTLEISLQPPEPYIEYWGQARRPNEAHEAFDVVRHKVSTAVDPFTPLTIASPSSDAIRPDLAIPGARNQYSGTKLYLPGANQRRHLARLPALPSARNKEWAPGASAWDMQNWLHAIIALDPKSAATRKAGYRDDKKRFTILSGTQLSWVADGEGEDDGIDLVLLVSIHVFMDLETVFLPLPDTGNDMLGLILHSLIPSSTLATFANDTEARAAALRDFYACLKPAPDLPFNYSAKRLQPKEMVSRLLPFQTRTLHLLLQREQADGVSRPSTSANSDPLGFWKAYDVGLESGRIGYRRLTGDLQPLNSGPVKVDRKGKGRASEGSPERVHDDLTEQEKANAPVLVDLSGVRGTMLCEEMGLGKTVEAIALVLLHRHPLSHPRDIAASKLNDASPAQASGGSSQKAVVPVIDLLKGTPGMEEPKIKEWVNAEHAAFAGRRVYDDQAKLHVTEVATTLIVTPPSLLRQWVSEMQRHAPTLRVCVYEGWKSLQKGIEKQRYARLKAQGVKNEAERKRKSTQFRDQIRAKYARGTNGTRVKGEEGDEKEVEVKDEDGAEESTLDVTQRQFVEYIRAHDIVITTYQDLSQDLKVALPAPSRSRRATANYQLNERPRSPLVMVEWWRVIMDEVQLHGDSTDAANMVSLIPRKNSLAVSGTPAKADIKDLMGSLKFLRVPILPNDNRLWHRLQQSSMRQAFEGLFRSIAVRTTKKEVSGEFNLPHQNRYVVPIELSEIEFHYYNDTLERFRERLHLPANLSVERPADWVLDRALFFVTLRNLRQICTHIQVGQMQGAGPRGEQRLNLGRTLMTMTEALEKMRNDHTQEYLSDSRKQMRAMITKAQLLLLNEQDDLRHLNALRLYEKVRETCERQLGPIREHLKTLLGGREDTVDLERDASPDKNQSQQDREKATQLIAARQSIRETSIILHQAWFFEGDVRHVQKEEEKEVDCYAKAEQIRKELLRRPLQTANLSVKLMQRSLVHGSAVHDVGELQTEHTNNRGGLLSADTMSQVNDLLEILNDNAYLVFEWRAKILALLSSPVEAEDSEEPAQQGPDIVEPEKEYYAEALKAQGEVEAYLIAFAAAVADRKEFLLEDRSLLAAHDAKQTKQRGTKAAINALATAVVDPKMLDVPDEVKEQAGELMQERQALRAARVEKDCERPLKGLLIDLNGIANGPNRPEEVAMAKKTVTIIRAYIAKQSEYVDKLNAELDLFRATFNRRVVYFAALQEISDSVSAPELKDLEKDLNDATLTIDRLEVKLSRMVVKGRYLQYLGNKDREDEDIREDCIICFGSSDATQAVLLACGHYFCLPCYREFRNSPMGGKCPSCRVEIDTKEITRIMLNAARIESPGTSDPAKVEEPESQELPEMSKEDEERARRAADLRRLKMLDLVKMREVMNMDMLGEYGSKINFLIKHLLHYKSREPDARHVIFSNWSDSLNIVMRALKNNGITFTSFEQGQRQKDVVDQFLKDDSISVFLLHAERESSGLTLTSCRVVHLLEPVLRHSFELQAIGRVDRLGQNKETTVYCYATMETVESRILGQGVRNGTSIYLADETADGVVADMPNVASAASKGGDVGGDANEEDLLGLIL